tara:strand:+ start:1764 stop:2855 length:1092 start_codon:yes stop_codon:yes gene_type:complete
MLGEMLCESVDEIVERWYQCWKETKHPHLEVSKTALKDHLPQQIRLIGSQLKKSSAAKAPKELWKITERLDPEARVSQEIPIEEVVVEYKILIQVIREWAEDRGLQIPFSEYSYLNEAVFELLSESSRRYSKYQAEQVSKTRQYYLAGVAHQMRNPLLVIQNQLELIQSGVELKEEAMERLVRNTGRLLFLVNSVLRLERFKASELPVSPKNIYPFDLLGNIVDDYRPFAQEKSIGLYLEVDRSLQMQADPDLLSDIFSNLIDNAIKYTEQGQVKVSFEDKDNSVIFRVEDTGPGMSEQRQKEMFEITTSGKTGGAGLGLVVVKRSVEAMQGAVAVESEIGKGSVFCVKLPKEVKAQNVDPSN